MTHTGHQPSTAPTREALKTHTVWTNNSPSSLIPDALGDLAYSLSYRAQLAEQPSAELALWGFTCCEHLYVWAPFTSALILFGGTESDLGLEDLGVRGQLLGTTERVLSHVGQVPGVVGTGGGGGRCRVDWQAA